MSTGSILLVDDDDLVLASLSLALEDAGFAVTTADNGNTAVELCTTQVFHVVVCDIRMPGMNGIETLRAIKQLHPDVRTIVITGYAEDPEAPVEAIGLGVDDYLLKPFDNSLLVHRLERNVERTRLEQDNARLHEELQDANERLERENRQLKTEVTGRYLLSDIIGDSRNMLAVQALLEPVIDSDLTVLITGETGTGKDLIARAVHYNGPRRRASFVPVHCGALQESLLESELFGVIPHYPGLHSPTGKKGLFEEADGGTLFLDEVGEMSSAMQVKLLRALQDGEFLRVGDTTPRRANVRIVAATNRDLALEVEEGRFRSDLYYRLAGVEVALPPLRERDDDVLRLATSALTEFGEGRSRWPASFSSEALELIEAYRWPGNVRELRKEIERAATMAGSDPIEVRHFSDRVSAAVDVPQAAGPRSLAETERRQIAGVLEETGWNVQAAARILGVHRNTLTRRIRDYDLRRN